MCFRKARSSCHLTARHRCIAERRVAVIGQNRRLFAAVARELSKFDTYRAQLVLTCCKEFFLHVF